MVELSTTLVHTIRSVLQYLIQYTITGIAVFFSVMIFLYTLMYLVIFFRVRYRLIRSIYFIILIFHIHFEPIVPFIMNLIADYHVVALLFIDY